MSKNFKNQSINNMIQELNIEDLFNRLEDEITSSGFAIADMALGNIYYNTNNCCYFTINKTTGDVYKLNHRREWVKEVGISVKFMLSQEYKKVKN